MSTGWLPEDPDSNRLIEDTQTESNKESSKSDKSELRLAQLQHQLPDNEPGALMHLVEESIADDADDSIAKDCRSWLRNLKFYLGREGVPLIYYSSIWRNCFMGTRRSSI